MGLQYVALLYYFVHSDKLKACRKIQKRKMVFMHNMEEKIVFCKGGGCTAKLGAGVLSRVLE